MGVQTVCLDPQPDAPAFRVCDRRIVAAYDDAEALERLCRECDVVTYEFENVPGEVLVPLCGRYNIKQGYRPLYDSQDRLREKDNARAHGLQTAEYVEVNDADDLRAAVGRMGLPLVFKTRREGYDSHGQSVIRSLEDVERIAPQIVAGNGIAERFVAFDFEASVVVVSDSHDTIAFPPARNIHREGILDVSIAPSGMPADAERRIIEQSKAFVRGCGYTGIMAIEYFVCGDRVLFNEMAPRPHNSGHYTIEGCDVSQYTELCRYLLDEPLRQPHLLSPTVMKNILGRDLAAAERLAEQCRDERVHVHLYGKSESRPRRKMGHITFTATTAEEFYDIWNDKFD